METRAEVGPGVAAVAGRKGFRFEGMSLDSVAFHLKWSVGLLEWCTAQRSKYPRCEISDPNNRQGFGFVQRAQILDTWTLWAVRPPIAAL